MEVDRGEGGAVGRGCGGAEVVGERRGRGGQGGEEAVGEAEGEALALCPGGGVERGGGREMSQRRTSLRAEDGDREERAEGGRPET